MRSTFTAILGRLNLLQEGIESLQETVDTQSRKLHAISRALSQLGDDSCESMAESARWREGHEQWTDAVTMSLSYLTDRKQRGLD
jgi:signal-transduction protein with cAMP-binding, CBS, and nucleotidyltransferase domain